MYRNHVQFIGQGQTHHLILDYKIILTLTYISWSIEFPFYIIDICLYETSYPTSASTLTLLHSERPKLYTILAFLSAIGLIRAPSYIKAIGGGLHVLWTHF